MKTPVTPPPPPFIMFILFLNNGSYILLHWRYTSEISGSVWLILFNARTKFIEMYN